MADQRDTEPTQAATYPHRTKPCSCETPNPLDTASADRNVSGYLGKAAAALRPGDPAAAGQWADGQRLRVLHGRAKAVAATLASVAARTRANPRTRYLDLTDLDKAVTYLEARVAPPRTTALQPSPPLSGRPFIEAPNSSSMAR